MSKFVLDELGMSINGEMDYNHLWPLVRERLGLLPQHIDPNLQGAGGLFGVEKPQSRRSMLPPRRRPTLRGASWYANMRTCE